MHIPCKNAARKPRNNLYVKFLPIAQEKSEKYEKLFRAKKDPWTLTTTKVSFFVQCTKIQLITSQNFDIHTFFSKFLWFFILKCWSKGQIMSRIHLGLPNAYKLMSFDRNINGNRDVKFLIAIIGHCTDHRKLLYK